MIFKSCLQSKSPRCPESIAKKRNETTQREVLDFVRSKAQREDRQKRKFHNVKNGGKCAHIPLPPKPSDWWTDSSTSTSKCSSSMVDDGDEPWVDYHRDEKKSKKDFRNCGEALWLKRRREFITYKGRVERKDLPYPYDNHTPTNLRKIRVNFVTQGHFSTRKTFELPKPMPLSDIVHGYVKVWNSDDDDSTFP
mmetsp:Transcript_16601/g.21605  ORF Transcript_16601/g.21605 Transcript_16601/m.21605 type:complete len:194 (-) Transcript_16601:292-873(-)